MSVYPTPGTPAAQDVLDAATRDSFPPGDPWDAAVSRRPEAAPVVPDPPCPTPAREEHDLDHLWDCIVGSSNA